MSSAEEQKKFNEEVKRGQSDVKNLSDEVRFLDNALRSIGATLTAAIDDALDGIKGVDTATKKVIKSYERDLTNQIKKVGVGLDKQLSLQKKIRAGQDVSAELEQIAAENADRRASIERNIVSLQQELVDAAGDDVEKQEEIKQKIDDLNNALTTQISLGENVTEELRNQNDEIQESLGGVTQLGAALDQFLNKLGLGQLSNFLGIDDAVKETQRMAGAAREAGEEFDGNAAFTQNLTSNLFSAKTATVLLIGASTKLFELFKKSSDKSAEIARTMGMAQDEASAFKDQLSGADDSFVSFDTTIKEGLEAVKGLNDGLGGVALTFNKEIITGAAESMALMGLSAEATAGMAKEAMIAGKSFAALEQEQAKILVDTEKEFGIRLDLSKVLDEANKLTGQARVNISKFPGGLVKAVSLAKSLGIEMDAVASAAGQLLDFEQSIEKELTAELMIGRDLNLERARAAALQGDQATLMQELVAQAGSLEQLQGMNVLQQNALAEALGMSADQLAASLETGAALSTQKDEDLARDEQALLAQNKMIGAGEAMARAMENAGDMMGKFTTALIIASGIAAGLAIILTFGTGTGILIAAAAATLAIIGAGMALQNVSDGMIKPGSGPFTITDGFGRTAITDKNDGIAVSPNISRDNTSSGGTDMRTTNALLRQLVAKREVVEIDGTNAGTAFGTSARRIQ